MAAGEQMVKLKRYESADEDGVAWYFWCPGCKYSHYFTTDRAKRPCWTFNGDMERPTFSPSLLVESVRPITEDERARIMRGEHVEPEPTRCHLHLREGRLEFCGDCSHALAGQTVELSEEPDS